MGGREPAKAVSGSVSLSVSEACMLMLRGKQQMPSTCGYIAGSGMVHAKHTAQSRAGGTCIELLCILRIGAYGCEIPVYIPCVVWVWCMHRHGHGHGISGVYLPSSSSSDNKKTTI